MLSVRSGPGASPVYNRRRRDRTPVLASRAQLGTRDENGEEETGKKKKFSHRVAAIPSAALEMISETRASAISLDSGASGAATVTATHSLSSLARSGVVRADKVLATEPLQTIFPRRKTGP